MNTSKKGHIGFLDDAAFAAVQRQKAKFTEKGRRISMSEVLCKMVMNGEFDVK